MTVNTIEMISAPQSHFNAEACEELAITILTSTADDPERLDIVRGLIQHRGASVTAPTPALQDPNFSCCIEAGDTPMHLAAKQFDRELCELLLQLGARACARNGVKKTPAVSAIVSADADDEYHERFITWLLQQPGAYDAADAGYEYGEEMRDLMPPSHSGVAHPIYDLVSRRFHEATEVMLNAGFPHGRHFMSHNSPLALAAEFDDGEMVRLLNRHGFHPDEFDLEGLSPLHHACRNDSCSAFAALVDAGATIDLEATSKMNIEFGQRPLMMAIRADHPRMVRALLVAGAKTDSAMDAAIRFDASDSVAQAIYDARLTSWTQEQLNSWLRDAVVHGNASIIEWLANQGADLRARHEGFTLLQLATQRGFPAIKRLLRSMNLRNRLMDALPEPSVTDTPFALTTAAAL